MRISDLESLLLSFNFARTDFPITNPLVVHGVPGCGKSTVILQLVKKPEVTAWTLGPAYGDNLAHKGVETLKADTRPPPSDIRVLDEYQLAEPFQLQGFNVVFGDPYQGRLRLPAHYIKRVSHRVPRPVCAFLAERKYEITSDIDGCLTTRGIGFDGPIKGPILHLGTVSRDFVHRHGLCSRSPTEVSGLEFPHVTLVYHTSELTNRSGFYIATTRARQELHLVSNEFHELSTTC